MKTMKIFFFAACLTAFSNLSFGQTNVEAEPIRHEISPIDPDSNPYIDENKQGIMYPENHVEVEIPWYYTAIIRFSFFMF